jgi:hypothetical protein
MHPLKHTFIYKASILSENESTLSCMVNTYGSRLEEALQESGKDRAELAQCLGISVQAIGQVMRGETRALTAENSAKAARFLGVDDYWLATGEGAKKKASETPSIDDVVQIVNAYRLGNKTQRAGLLTMARSIVESSSRGRMPGANEG